MEHFFSPASCFILNLHWRKSCYSFVLEVTYFVCSFHFVCHFIASLEAVVVFAPPSPSCSAVCLDQAPAPPLSTSMFFLKNKILINGGEKAVALCCDFFLRFVFLNLSFCAA